MPKSETQNFDLEERTAKFGEAIIAFLKTLPSSKIVDPIVSQLIRSATSVGANYFEANCAETRKDFVHKIGLCKEEAGGTRYWLRMLSGACPEKRENSLVLWKEADQLYRIFITIVRKTRENSAA